jgi:hypothetical protein
MVRRFIVAGLTGGLIRPLFAVAPASAAVALRIGDNLKLSGAQLSTTACAPGPVSPSAALTRSRSGTLSGFAIASRSFWGPRLRQREINLHLGP